jgi:hypothetical protein
MAEDFDNGPSGIIANPGWRYITPVPRGMYLLLSFQFNAAWENMIWVCNSNTHEQLSVRGNYFRSRDLFATDVNSQFSPSFGLGLVAYHKLVSPDAGADKPWRQSPMAILHDDGKTTIIGFNDEGGPGFNQAVCSITRVTSV